MTKSYKAVDTLAPPQTKILATPLPSFTSLNCMLLICERFAKEYDMVFNTSKSKLILFPDLGNTTVIIPFVGGAIEHVADHLGCIIGAESDRKNIERTISYFYAKAQCISS